MTSTREVAEALYRAFLAGDKDGMLALMAEDVHVRFLGQAQFVGRAELDRFIDFSASLLTDVHFTLRHLVVDGEVAAGIWEETATTRDGQPWRNHGVDVIRLRAGKVVALHENNDVREVHRHFPAYRPARDGAGSDRTAGGHRES